MLQMVSVSDQKSELRELDELLELDARFQELLSRDPIDVLREVGLTTLAAAVEDERIRTERLIRAFDSEDALWERLEREPIAVLEEHGFPAAAAEPVLVAVGASDELIAASVPDFEAHLALPGRKTAAVWATVAACLGAAAYSGSASARNPVEPDQSLGASYAQKHATATRAAQARRRAAKKAAALPLPVRTHVHLVVNDPDE
jgi:hypothetical protein